MKVTIIGMGALGLLFGNHFMNQGHIVVFLMDESRYYKHHNDVYKINGEIKDFNISYKAAYSDLVIFATKYNGFKEAIELAKGCVHNDTIIISLLNGILTETMLKETFNSNQVIGTIAVGMDAMRKNTNLEYSHFGKLQIGSSCKEEEPYLNNLVNFFKETNTPYEIKDNINKALWAKFLLNVGINQTCMIYDINYGEALHIEPYRTLMIEAMNEVILLSKYENINLTKEDLDNALKILESLNPTSIPSMAQDCKAKRKSEVELFAGTMIQLANKHHIEVPRNQEYYKLVLEKESKY